MSRDFELLQRLEREWGRPSILPEFSGPAVPVSRQGGTLKIAQEWTGTPAGPAADLSAKVRGELTKLILSTFLGNPAKKVILFTGVEAGDYAKWAAAYTADLLADTSCAPVCLMDADQAVPTMHGIFSVSNQSGLAGLLAGTISIDRAAIRTRENLWVIPAGAQPTNRAVAPAIFQQVITDVLDQCEYIVIAAPDYGRYTEISSIGQAAEGAILVLDAVKTRRVAAQDAKAALESTNIRVLGSVVNNDSYAETEPPYLSA